MIPATLNWLDLESQTEVSKQWLALEKPLLELQCCPVKLSCERACFSWCHCNTSGCVLPPRQPAILQGALSLHTCIGTASWVGLLSSLQRAHGKV